MDQQKKKLQREGIVILSLDEIIVFTLTSSEFSTNYINLKDNEDEYESVPICGMSMIADHKN